MRTTKGKKSNAANAKFGGGARTRKRNKYGVAPAWQRTFEGTLYASKAECIRAQELRLLLKSGEIRQIVEQPHFELGIPENLYVADFKLTRSDGTVWVEDVKGAETREFRKNKKLWRKYGKYTLVILTRKGSGWTKEVIEPENMEAEG